MRIYILVMIILICELGFIGSNILSKLNYLKKSNILLLDSSNKKKLVNAKGLDYVNSVEKKIFYKNLYKINIRI